MKRKEKGEVKNTAQTATPGILENDVPRNKPGEAEASVVKSVT